MQQVDFQVENCSSINDSTYLTLYEVWKLTQHLKFSGFISYNMNWEVT